MVRSLKEESEASCGGDSRAAGGGVAELRGSFLNVLDPTGTVRRRLWTRADFMHIHAVSGAYFLSRQLPLYGCSIYYEQFPSAGRAFLDLRNLLRTLGLGGLRLFRLAGAQLRRGRRQPLGRGRPRRLVVAGAVADARLLERPYWRARARGERRIAGGS